MHVFLILQLSYMVQFGQKSKLEYLDAILTTTSEVTLSSLNMDELSL